jgi:hypothetical protein
MAVGSLWLSVDLMTKSSKPRESFVAQKLSVKHVFVR